MTVISSHPGVWLRPKVEGLAPAGRGGHSSTLAGDRLLVFGGADRAPTPFDDLYELELGQQGQYTWTRVQATGGQQVRSRAGASLTALDDGCAYLFGGQEPSTGACFSDVWRLDTAVWSWTRLQPRSGAPPPRHSHCAGRLTNGCIVVYGGASQSNSMFGDVWVFNVTTVEWKRIDVAGNAPTPREMATGTMLDDARMLVVGGRAQDGSTLRDVAVLDMARESWRAQPPLCHACCAHSATLLPRDSMSEALLDRFAGAMRSTLDRPPADAPVLVLFGGFTGEGVSGGVTLIDTATMASVDVGAGAAANTARPAPRFAHSCAAVPSVLGVGKKAVLVFGGVSAEQDLSDLCLWMP